MKTFHIKYCAYAYTSMHYTVDRVHAVRIGTYPRVTDLNQELQGSALNYVVGS
jgi:hypothetical protein